MPRPGPGRRAETAQCWAPENSTIAGHSEGLWEVGEDPQGDRVYFSSSGKASTHGDKARDDTKLTRHMKNGKLVMSPKRNAWNPTLLEITVAGCTPDDAPDAWAMYVHQQRFADDYRDALKFPSPCTWPNWRRNMPSRTTMRSWRTPGIPKVMRKLRKPTARKRHSAPATPLPEAG